MVDILILGATGYTGRLITRYLHVHREREGFTLGIAGRSDTKLKELVEDLSLEDSVKIFKIDVTKEEELERVIPQAKVVINTVGPFLKWSKPVVKFCAKKGVHYVDINGETPFVKDIIAEYDYLAVKSKAIIIPSCGFDSLPADVSAYLSAKTLHNLRSSSGSSQGDLSSADIESSSTVYSVKGGVSGGTLSTGIMLAELKRKKGADGRQAWGLSPVKGGPSPPFRFVYSIPRVGKSSRTWGFPIPLNPHNVAIVQRSWGLLHLAAIDAKTKGNPFADNASIFSYGQDFQYVEFAKASNPISAFFLGFSFALGMAAMVFIPPVRWFLKKFGPQAGEGPSDEKLDKGFVKARNVTFSKPDPKTKKVTVVESVFSGKGDPGYLLTAIMISEAALAIFFNKKSLPPLAQEGGVLTPVTGLGDVILDRLKDTGRFTVESHVVEDA